MSASVATSTKSAPEPSIKVRRMDFEFGEETPTFWFDDNPLLTATLSALAVSFPPGERYFIASVRHFLDRVKDPELLAQVKAFVGQEANHTKEHIAFNQFLDSRGFPATAMEKWVADRVAELQKRSSPEANLARTAALEHFTAILASVLLEHPEIAQRMSPEVAKLWVWHAIEEVEHRSVAFDVYKTAVDDEQLRIKVMLLTTVIFITVNAVRTTMLLRASGRQRELLPILKALNVMWGRPGLFRKVVPRYLEYFRKDFHPSQLDSGAFLEAAKRQYLGAAA
ncbi:MAG: metal-dependent hydrolase [Polyangiaceae bacterium]|nr:metal-dependent hydrolase [Myxococcales bacterium]MCB9586135.1 metal-dependent hydrolase [Polyangiaceae bacterium]MCB9606813.1 metal-dependent hydrolase [Polyangiaceae bacterium]